MLYFEKRGCKLTKDCFRDGKHMNWMIAMDGFEAFIQIAEYTQEYVDYLCRGGRSTTNKSFMNLKEYGLFDLRVYKGGMELFLAYVWLLSERF